MQKRGQEGEKIKRGRVSPLVLPPCSPVAASTPALAMPEGRDLSIDEKPGPVHGGGKDNRQHGQGQRTSTVITVGEMWRSLPYVVTTTTKDDSHAITTLVAWHW